jgi:hypothetical protein
MQSFLLSCAIQGCSDGLPLGHACHLSKIFWLDKFELRGKYVPSCGKNVCIALRHRDIPEDQIYAYVESVALP